MDDQGEAIKRRKFLTGTIYTVGGLIGAGLALPGIGYIAGPALQPTQAGQWLRLGSASKVEIGTPTLFQVKVTRQTGWLTSEMKVGVFVLTENGRDFIAMSNTCTHLGCRIRWIPERGQFFSPCHNGVFDRYGNVVSGPPPRPLDRYKIKVENGQLLIMAYSWQQERRTPRVRRLDQLGQSARQ